MKETFGKRLFKLRTEAGWTQRQLGDKVKLSPQRINQLEDMDNVKLTVLRKLAKAFGKNISELLPSDPA